MSRSLGLTDLSPRRIGGLINVVTVVVLLVFFFSSSSLVYRA